MLSDTSLARLGEVHPELARRIKSMDALAPALSIQVTQGLRTWMEQSALYARGRTAPGPIVTNAEPAQSAHVFGYAVDLVPEDIINGQPDWNRDNAAWKQMLSVGVTCGLAEGAEWRTFPDYPHFYLQELPATPTQEMLYHLTEGGILAVWQSFPAPLNNLDTVRLDNASN